MTKFKIGDRVVPVSKSVYGSLENSCVWTQAQEKDQPFIYVTGYEGASNNKDVIMCDVDYNSGTGDFFLENDLVKYEEENTMRKLQIGDRVCPATEEYRLDSSTFGNGRKFATVSKIDGTTITFKETGLNTHEKNLKLYKEESVMKFQRGDKVIPVAKTSEEGCSLNECNHYKKIKAGERDFLYIARYDEEVEAYVVSSDPHANQGNYYNEQDLVKYEEFEGWKLGDEFTLWGDYRKIAFDTEKGYIFVNDKGQRTARSGGTLRQLVIDFRGKMNKIEPCNEPKYAFRGAKEKSFDILAEELKDAKERSERIRKQIAELEEQLSCNDKVVEKIRRDMINKIEEI